jgi:hypothetical protein
MPTGARCSLLELTRVDFTDDENVKEWNDFQSQVRDVSINIEYRSVDGDVKQLV